VWGVPYLAGTMLEQAPQANPRVRRALASYAAMLAYVPPAQEFFDRVPAWMLPSRHTAVGFVGEVPLPPVAGAKDLIVVACGGGSTARDLCGDALAAWWRLPEPRPPIRLVVGPLGEEGDIRALDHAAAAGVEVVARGELRDVIRDASVVISRAGYNSVALLLQTSLPIVLSPASVASQDQVERVAALRGTPGVWSVEDSGARHVDGLHRALIEARALTSCAPRLVADGAARAAQWLLNEAAVG
jgi:predicted glycosyltransferase